MSQKNILIVSGDLRRPGGVVNLVGMLKSSFSSAMDITYFRMGPRESSSLKMPRVLYPLIDSIRLAATLFWHRYELVHINPSLDWKSLLRDGLFMLVLRITRTPRKIVFFHGWDIDVANQITKSLILRTLFQWTFGQADKTIILANKFREPLGLWGVSEDSIELYSTMFDGDIFLGKQVSERRSSNNNLAMVFLSRFVKGKGVYETLEAFEIIRQQIPKATLEMVGDGPERTEMESWVQEHGFEDCITFPGYLRGKQKVEAMIRAELFVFPTFYREGCPVSLLEAMAVGLPIVTTDVGGIPDIFIHRENGLMLSVPPQSKDIADAVVELAGDQKMMVSIAKNNREQAWSRYEAAIVTAKLEMLYNELLKAV
jgi:glycosyltransferase involved in cell wall biosynthesis